MEREFWYWRWKVQSYIFWGTSRLLWNRMQKTRLRSVVKGINKEITSHESEMFKRFVLFFIWESLWKKFHTLQIYKCFFLFLDFMPSDKSLHFFAVTMVLTKKNVFTPIFGSSEFGHSLEIDFHWPRWFTIQITKFNSYLPMCFISDSEIFCSTALWSKKKSRFCTYRNNGPDLLSVLPCDSAFSQFIEITS